jgi:hypothetical protein
MTARAPSRLGRHQDSLTATTRPAAKFHSLSSDEGCPSGWSWRAHPASTTAASNAKAKRELGTPRYRTWRTGFKASTRQSPSPTDRNLTRPHRQAIRPARTPANRT